MWSQPLILSAFAGCGNSGKHRKANLEQDKEDEYWYLKTSASGHAFGQLEKSGLLGQVLASLRSTIPCLGPAPNCPGLPAFLLA